MTKGVLSAVSWVARLPCGSYNPYSPVPASLFPINWLLPPETRAVYRSWDPERTAIDQNPSSLLEQVRQPFAPEAWLRFVALYAPLIYFWGRRVGLQEPDATDLVQEVFVTLLQILPTFTYDVAQKGILPVEYSCQCVARVELGLQWAYEMNMVHRDVTPANLILASKEKDVKLLDIGLARGPREQMAKIKK
jgi:hypothetical protein